jgi:hypothetical protein
MKGWRINLAKKVYQDAVDTMRKAAVFTPEGRMILIANAHAYGYEVDDKGVIRDEKGEELDPKHEDFKAIKERAEAVAPSSLFIGEELLKNPMEE